MLEIRLAAPRIDLRCKLRRNLRAPGDIYLLLGIIGFLEIERDLGRRSFSVLLAREKKRGAIAAGRIGIRARDGFCLTRGTAMGWNGGGTRTKVGTSWHEYREMVLTNNRNCTDPL